MLLVEQNAQAALKIADRAYVMELGEFVLNGAASEIATNQRVAASYLGFHARRRERDLERCIGSESDALATLSKAWCLRTVCFGTTVPT